MAAFVICVKQPGHDWTINGWTSHQGRSERLATKLTEPPFMAETSAVFAVGGSDALPTFTLTFQAKGQS